MASPSGSPRDNTAVDALLDAVDQDDAGSGGEDHMGGRPVTGKGSRGSYKGGYNDAISSAVPFLAERPRMAMGAVEILAFFPHLMQWPDALFRLLRHGWTASDIAAAQVYARDALTEEDHRKRYDSLRHQFKPAGNEKLGVNDFTMGRYKDHAELQPFTAANMDYDTAG